jgi:cardiolipin synthase A/B
MTETAPDLPKTRLLSRLRSFCRRRRRRLISGLVAVAHTAGALTSVEAIMETRTSQGAVAWALSLNLFPYAAVPAYWIFGHTEMEGYVVARRSSAAKFQEVGGRLKSSLDAGDLRSEVEKPMGRMLEALRASLSPAAMTWSC